MDGGTLNKHARPRAASAAESSKPQRNWWTEDEDRVLQREVHRRDDTSQPNYWSSIAEKLPGRSNKDCRKRWSKVSEATRKGPWDGGEDEMLRKAVAKHGCRWADVAKDVENRSPDQCSKRWLHFLNPQLDRGKWTPDADERLLRAVDAGGRDWKGIVETEFPLRSPTDVRNRFSKLQHSKGSYFSDGQSGSQSSSRSISQEAIADVQQYPSNAPLVDGAAASWAQDTSGLNQLDALSLTNGGQQYMPYAQAAVPISTNDAVVGPAALSGSGNDSLSQFDPYFLPNGDPTWNWALDPAQPFGSDGSNLYFGMGTQHMGGAAAAASAANSAMDPTANNQPTYASLGDAGNMAAAWSSIGGLITPQGVLTELSQLPKASQEQIPWFDMIANAPAPPVDPSAPLGGLGSTAPGYALPAQNHASAMPAANGVPANGVPAKGKERRDARQRAAGGGGRRR